MDNTIDCVDVLWFLMMCFFTVMMGFITLYGIVLVAQTLVPLAAPMPPSL